MTKKINLTSAGTDTESGHEGLSSEDDKEKSLAALKIMYERGLIHEGEYKKRIEALNA